MLAPAQASSLDCWRRSSKLDFHTAVWLVRTYPSPFTLLITHLCFMLSAVEPVQAMREQCQAQSPNVVCVAGSAEQLPVPFTLPSEPAPIHTVNAVVCAQAFHRFATPKALQVTTPPPPPSAWSLLTPSLVVCCDDRVYARFCLLLVYWL